MLRKVYLEGEIGDKFGHEFDMSVSSFGEAVACFEANFDNFRQYLMDSQDKGIGFICSIEGKPVEVEEDLLLQYPEGSLTIQAVPLGSKSGIGKIIVGIVLIALAVITQQYYLAQLALGPPTAFVALLPKIALGLVMLGSNLILTGIQQIMSPDPSVDNQQDESYLFQGSSHTIIEGDPVPILYGQLRVPGRPISFEIKNQNRSFVDYAQDGYDFTTPSQPGDTNQPNTGPSYDEEPVRDTDGFAY